MAVSNPQEKNEARYPKIRSKQPSKLSGENCDIFGFMEYDISSDCNKGLSGKKESNSTGKSLSKTRENIKQELVDGNDFQLPPLADDRKSMMRITPSRKPKQIVGPPKVDVESCESPYILEADNRVSPTKLLEDIITKKTSATHILPNVYKKPTPPSVFDTMSDDLCGETCDQSEEYQIPSKKRRKKRKLFGSIGDTANAKRIRSSISYLAKETGKKRVRTNSETTSKRFEKATSSCSASSKLDILFKRSKDIKTFDSGSANAVICQPDVANERLSSFKQKSKKKASRGAKHSKLKRKQSSKYYGVSRFKGGVSCKWLAKCGRKHIGYFVMEEEAASAVDKYLDILGIDKRFRNLGSSKAALRMMCSGKLSRKWKRTYAAKVQAGEVENLPVTPDEKPLSLLELKLYDNNLVDQGVSLADLYVEDEPEIREVKKKEDLLASGIKNHSSETIDRRKMELDRDHGHVTEYNQSNVKTESIFNTIASESTSAQLVPKETSDLKAECGLSTILDDRLKDIAEKKLLLDIMNKTGCPRGVKKEEPSLDNILSCDINHLEVNLNNKINTSPSSYSISPLSIFPADQTSPSFTMGDVDCAKINTLQNNEQGINLSMTSQYSLYTQPELLPHLRVKSSIGLATSLAGQCIQTMLEWKSKKLLSISEYLTGLRMLDGRYGEITAFSSRGLLNIGDIDTFKASIEELEEHPKKL